MTKTVSALFDHYSDAAAAVKAMEDSGIPHADISIVANNADKWHTTDKPTEVAKDAGTGAGVGAAVGGGVGLLAGLGMLAIPGVGPVVAAGWLVATAVGAAAGAAAGGAAGGIVGAMTESGVPVEDANVYAEGVRRGGALVTARVADERATTANAILQRYRSVDIGTRRTAYRANGWSTFDDNAPLYTDAQVREERNRYR